MVAASVILRAFLVASARCEGLQGRPHTWPGSRLVGWVVGLVVAKGNERNSQLQLTESPGVSQAVNFADPPPESESQVTIAKQVIK